jgi:hypothetical protein
MGRADFSSALDRSLLPGPWLLGCQRLGCGGSCPDTTARGEMRQRRQAIGWRVSTPSGRATPAWNSEPSTRFWPESSSA